jgi:prepilin-type processing-associated H-X9-DG protein
MRNRTGLTRVDLIVVVACVFFVLANVPVIIAAGRGRAKIEVCMANLRALADAWQMNSNDNDGKIASGDVWYSWTFPTSAGGPQLAWREWPHPAPHPMPPSAATNYTAAYPLSCTTCTQADWQHAIAEGKMWEYVRDYNFYRCPAGNKNQYVTYSMSHSMNTWPGVAGTNAPVLTNINQIIRPAEKFVFLDAGFAKQGAFFVSFSGSGSTAPGRWYDHPPMLHNQGTTFVFADGHAIYRKWTDPHALQAGWSGGWGGTVDYCDCDLRWITKATWGRVPYDCTDPNKNCPD